MDYLVNSVLGIWRIKIGLVTGIRVLVEIYLVTLFFWSIQASL